MPNTVSNKSVTGASAKGILGRLLAHCPLLHADLRADRLQRLRDTIIKDLTTVMDSYDNLATPLHIVIRAYNDFHQKLELEMQGNIEWVDGTGEPLPVDQQSAVIALLLMLGAQIGKALGAHKLESSDEENMVNLIRRHRTKVEEVVNGGLAPPAEKTDLVVITTGSTPTAKLAGEKLQKRMFQ